MNFSFPQLLAGSVGALLIYCAIVNKTPVAVIQDTFNTRQTGIGNDPKAKSTSVYKAPADMTKGNPPIGAPDPKYPYGAVIGSNGHVLGY